MLLCDLFCCFFNVGLILVLYGCVCLVGWLLALPDCSSVFFGVCCDFVCCAGVLG